LTVSYADHIMKEQARLLWSTV